MKQSDTVLQRMFEMGRIMKQSALGSGGSMPLHYIETLRFVKDANPTMRDVADYLHVTAPSATSLIETLAKAGFVKRAEDKGDRRVVRITLSQKGKTKLGAAATLRAKALRSIIEKLSLEDQRDLARILEKIITTHHQ